MNENLNLNLNLRYTIPSDVPQFSNYCLNTLGMFFSLVRLFVYKWTNICIKLSHLFVKS